ncbi:hypothetical protein MRX96_045694 [Rhipicephalus microplus]
MWERDARFPTDVGEGGVTRWGTTIVLPSAARMREEIGGGAEKRGVATSLGALAMSVVEGEEGGVVCSQE